MTKNIIVIIQKWLPTGTSHSISIKDSKTINLTFEFGFPTKIGLTSELALMKLKKIKIEIKIIFFILF